MYPVGHEAAGEGTGDATPDDDDGAAPYDRHSRVGGNLAPKTTRTHAMRGLTRADEVTAAYPGFRAANTPPSENSASTSALSAASISPGPMQSSLRSDQMT